MTVNLPSTPVRVLNITKSTGGLANYNYRLCQWFDPKKVKMDVICLSTNNQAYAASLAELGIKAIPMEMERYAINPGSDLRLIWQIWQFVRQGDYDVIVGNGSKAGFIVRLVGRLTSTPAVYRLASMSFLPRIHGRKAYLYLVLEYIISLFGGRIVVLSNSTKNYLTRLKLAAAKQISIIYTGVDVSVFRRTVDPAQARISLGLDPNRPVVGWMARSMPQKAPLDFIKAMAGVCRVLPTVQIFIAGEGPLQAEMQQLITDLGLENNVIMAPWQSQANLPSVLAAFDVYVLSSYWEGLPISLLEAMSAALPSVATAVDGTSEVINHGVDGYLVPAGDISQLATCTIKLLTDDDLRHQMSQMAQARIISHFNVEQMIVGWEALFFELAGK